MVRLTFLTVTSLAGLAAAQTQTMELDGAVSTQPAKTGFSPFNVKASSYSTVSPASRFTVSPASRFVSPDADLDGDSDNQVSSYNSGWRPNFPTIPGWPNFPGSGSGGSSCNVCGPDTCGFGRTCIKRGNDYSCLGECSSNGIGNPDPWPPSGPGWGGSPCNSCSNNGCSWGERCVSDGFNCRGRCERTGGNNPNNPYSCEFDYQCNNGETCDRGICRRDYWGNRPELPTGTKSCYARNCWDCLDQYGCLWDPNTASGTCKPKEQCDFTYEVARPNGMMASYSTPSTACVKSQSQCGSRPPPGAILERNNERGYGCTNHGQCGRGQYCYSCNKCRGNCGMCSPRVSGVCGPVSQCYVDRDSIDGRCP